MESLQRDEVTRRNRNLAGKVLTISGFLLIAIIVLTVMSKDEGRIEDKSVVTLNMWDVPRTDVSIPSVRADRAVHVEFLRQHPEIKIVRTRGIMAAGPASSSAFYMAMAGGTGPDLFAMGLRKVGSYIQEGFVQPLDDFIEEWPEARAKILEQMRPAVSRTEIVDGKPVTHIYALPMGYSLKGCYYRKALFQEAGLPIEGPDLDKWNWDMMWEYAKKMTFPEQGRFGLSLPMSGWGGWMYMDFVWQAGGDIVREYGVDPQTGELYALPPADAPDEAWLTPAGVDLRGLKRVWRAVYDEAPGVTALEYYKKLRWAPWTRCRNLECLGKNVCYDITDEMTASGKARCPECEQEIPISRLEEQGRIYKGVLWLDADGEEELRRFNTEKRIGMFIWTSDGVAVANTEMDPDDIGLLPTPAGPTGIRASSLNATMWGISSQLTDPAKIRAAWEYIKFQASDEAERLRAQTLVEAGQGRYLDPVVLKKYGSDEFVRFVPKGWTAAYKAAREYGRVEPYAPNYTNVQTSEMAIFIDSIFTDEHADPAAQLASSVKKVNETIFQEVPEQVMNRRRRIAYWVMAAVGVAFVALMVVLGRSIKGLVDAVATKRRMGLKFSQTSLAAAWAFMLPAVVTVLVWQYVPLVRGSGMAFMDYKVIGESKFIGLDNFILVFTDPVFWHSLWVTAFYVTLSIGLQFTAPIALALLLAEVPRGKVMYRLIYYLPAVTSGLVIMFLWKEFYDPSTGVFNTILTYFGFERSDWLSSGKWWLPMVCIIVPMVWASAGPRCLIYLAALKSVPEEMYEAADIDGASTWGKVRYITLPYLKPLIIINFVGAFIGAFQAMQQIFVMTGGGPARATHVIGLEIWYNAFMYLKFGYATAEAWLIASLLIGFTVYQLQILKRVRFTTAKV